MTSDIPDEMPDALMRQARACRALGSLMYGEVLDGILDDYIQRGTTYAILHNCSPTPLHDASPLRALGTLHRIVLEGRDAELAVHYPSVGGAPKEFLVPDFIKAFSKHAEEIQIGLKEQVQTNEPGRAIVHTALAYWLAENGITTFRLLEVGASAGLTMSFDHYRDDLFFSSQLISEQFTNITTPAECIDRRGVDINPIDLSKSSNINRLLSFVWPDQQKRIQRMRAAIEITASLRHVIDNESVDTWLPKRLNENSTSATVVFHSIVWQYLGRQVQDSMRHTLTHFGSQATRDTPLIWARMEPNGAMADVRATVWDGSATSPTTWKLADVGYHGDPFVWDPQLFIA
jgi:hypothetical protein